MLYAGSSNFAGWHIAQAQEARSQRHFVGLVSEQSIYNLMKRGIELEVIPAPESTGSASSRGRRCRAACSAGCSRRPCRRVVGFTGRTSWSATATPLRHTRHLAAELGHEPAELGLAWLLHQPAVTAPIIGPRTADQLTSALNALDIKLDRSVLGRLDELFPGHKTAPEDYAW